MTAYEAICKIAKEHPEAKLARFLAGETDGDPDVDDGLLEEACQGYIKMVATQARCHRVIGICEELILAVVDGLDVAGKKMEREAE